MLAVNFPFIKKVIFSELNCPNNEKLNRRMKSEFLMFLNCRKYRSMHFVHRGTEKDPYCSLEMNDRILNIKANRGLIQIFIDLAKKFDNISDDMLNQTN